LEDKKMAEYNEFEVFTDYRIFDADQHLMETEDCYSKFIPKEFAERTLREVTGPDGHAVFLADDKVVKQDNHTDRMSRPGSLKELLKGMKKGSSDPGAYRYMEIDPAFQDRDLRLKVMDKQNIEACFMYPNSLGLVAEHYLEDEDVYYASSWSYLRWLEESWGFSAANRIFTAPIFSMRNVDRTVVQLDWFFEHGGKTVGLVPGPAHGRSPGDPYFDRFWGRIADANGIAIYHINEAGPGYKNGRSAPWGEEIDPSFFTQSAWQWYWAYGDIPAQETFASLIYSNLFQRFPTLKVVSAEHGCEWAPLFARKLDKMRGMGRNGHWIGGQLPERPSEIFKRHFRLVPFWEDDVEPVIDTLGRGMLIGGSDFPHAEGLAFPTQLVEHLSKYSPEDQKFILRDNAMEFIS
jgi:predicted TIM-barrel fold metal-dependent hydrolase